MRYRKRHGLLLLLLIFGMNVSIWSQMIMKNPKKNGVLDNRRIFVTVLGKAGAKTWLYVNNVLADSGEIRIDGKYDFLNIEVPPGPVELRTEAVGAGNRIFSAKRKVHIVGPPDTLITDPAQVELPADGESLAKVHVKIMDAWGYEINRLKVVNVKLTDGRIVEADIDSISDGHQLPIKNSEFALTLQSAKSVGKRKLTFNIEGFETSMPVRYTTPLTRFMLVGSADAAISASEFGDKDHEFPKFTIADYTHQERDIRGTPASGRLALYAKGAVMDKYQITTSFDSRRTRETQLFRDLDPDKQYALYGDASTLTYDAQSQAKFYGKIERNESFVQIGDFNTSLQGSEFANYNRTFNGLYSRLQYKSHQLTSFATLNDRSMQLDEIRGEGISGYYYLTQSRITINSDKVRIETRDRYHPERIVKSEDKVRYADYDINYVDGTLMFKQPVPAIDGSGNPVFIVAAYEHRSDADKSLITGLRYKGAFHEMRFGSTFIMEEKKPSNYYLYGSDVTLPVGTWMELKGEIAQSRNAEFSADPKKGTAWSTNIQLTPVEAVLLKGYYRKMDSDFLNQSQTGSRFEIGAEKYGTSGALNFGKYGAIQSEYYKQLNSVGTINENHTQVGNVFYTYKLASKTTAKIGYENAEREKITPDTLARNRYTSKMLKGKVLHRVNKRLSVALEHDQNLDKSNVTALPTGSSIGLGYRLTEKIQLFAKQRLLSSGKRKTQTILGIDSKFNESTSMSGKYEIGGAAGEDLNRATIGLNNKWEVRKDITLNLTLQSTATMDSLEVPTPDQNSISIGAEYLPDKPCKASSKFELRQDKTVRKRVITLGGEAKIRGGLSAISLLEYSSAEYLGTSNDVLIRNNYQLGVAYRPENQDRFNGIAKVQLLHDKNTHVAPRMIMNRYIVSAHGYWQAMAKLDIGLRFALRQLLDEETGYFSTKTTTALYALRADYQLHRRWMTSLDLRYLTLSPINQSKTGAAGEVGYVVKQNMLLGIGYVFRQLNDPDFSYSEYEYTNIYLILRMKFSEDLFHWR